jgi:xylose isomerase
VALIEGGELSGFVADRYKGWKSGVGKAILDGTTNLVEISDTALADGVAPMPRSGRQEYLENIITRNS